MERKQIIGLLEKYYEGLSSRDEERKLLDYFLGSDVPDELDIDRKHFLALADMQNEEIEVPEDLEANILARLKIEQEPKFLSNKRFLYTALSVAAGLALIVSTFMFLNRQQNTGTYDDPQIAYAETKEALEMVSHFFNMGTEKLSGLGEMDRALQPLNQLKKVGAVSDKLKYLGKFDEGMRKFPSLLKTEIINTK